MPYGSEMMNCRVFVVVITIGHISRAIYRKGKIEDIGT
jgi:hypothetical protein